MQISKYAGMQECKYTKRLKVKLSFGQNPKVTQFGMLFENVTKKVKVKLSFCQKQSFRPFLN